MSDLTEFLLARIEEDEQRARGVVGDMDGEAIYVEYAVLDASERRVLAEVEAKRRIVGLMGYVRESWENKHSGEGRVMWPDVSRREKMHALTILENLAAPYADHEDYREEWKP